jgi:ubiquinone/menaquinone biosynthesis C-methylase UbiE
MVSTLARTRYVARQRGLALSMSLAGRVMSALAPRRHAPPPPRAPRALWARSDELFRQDLSTPPRGVYPAELLHDFSLGELMGTLPLALADLPRTLARVRRGDHEDLPEGIDRSRYPRYYLRNFHWQTDGWLSERSARLYDFSVDVLFGGTTDVMRRMTLPPVVAALADRPAPRILDVACGTGRFLGQLHAALPRARLYGVDLSGPYLSRARDRLAGLPDLSLLCENAEALPFADATFDAVTCVFLFHELPRQVRRRVLDELRRVLAPGGTVVICDSAQLHDSPELGFFLEAFPRLYHEPYYRSYLRDPLEAQLAEAGFDEVEARPWFVAKVASGRKR